MGPKVATAHASAPITFEHASSEPRAPGETSAPKVPGPGAVPAPRGGLVLPFDAQAIARALPAPSVANYDAWTQAKRVNVGLGYLYSLEPVNAERWMLVQSDEQPTVFVYDNHTYANMGKWPVASTGDNDNRTIVAWPNGVGSDKAGSEPRFLSGGANGIALYNAANGHLVKQFSQSPIGQARWSDDGLVLMAVTSRIETQTSVMAVYHKASELDLVHVASLPTSERVDAWDLSRDNRYLARGFYPSGKVTIVDLHTEETVLVVNAPGHASSLEFSPDERVLAIGGEGVVFIDLAHPERRAEYSYFYNNVSEVEFSPSGDMLAVASFDGRVRLLRYSPELNRVELVHTLRHERQANVYGVRFIDNGTRLVSSSGDRTLRYWGASAAVPPKSPSPTIWQSIGQRLGASSTARSAVGDVDDVPLPPHYVPSRLSAPPLPSRIAPGRFACKITALYKLRDCVVEKDERGHTLLEFSKDNLLGVRAVLYDDGPLVRFEGWLTDGGSFGCARCNQQPIHGFFKGGGDKWQGLLLYRKHFDPLVPHEPPRADTTIEEAIDRYPLVLERR